MICLQGGNIILVCGVKAEAANIIKIAIHGWESGILNDEMKLNNGKIQLGQQGACKLPGF
jgi:hypothetical protein